MAQAEKTETQTLPSAFSLFRPSWRALLVNWETLITQIIVPFATIVIGLALILATHGSALQLPFAIIGAVVTAAGIVVALAAAPAITYIQVRSAQGISVAYRDSFGVGLHFFWRIWAVNILVGLAVFVGFLLLIVPGLFIWRRYLLAQYILVDRDLGVFEALHQSAELSKKYSSALWGWIGVQFLIIVPSFIPIIGAFITWFLDIVYYCATAVRYEEIKAAEAVVGTPPKKMGVKRAQSRSKKSN